MKSSFDISMNNNNKIINNRLNMNNNISNFREKNNFKKLKIKPFNKKPSISEDFEKNTWKKIYDAIIAIQNETSTDFSREDLYRAVENICSWKKSDILFNYLKETCKKHISEQIQNITNTLNQKEISYSFLDNINNLWNKYRNQLKVIRTIFLYLDRSNIQKISIWEMGLDLFREEILSRKNILDMIIKIVINHINMERNGEKIAEDIVYNIVKMMIQLKFYKSYFEEKYIVSCQKYYDKEGKYLVNKGDILEFLHIIEKRLKEENQRCLNYFDQSSKKLIILTTEKYLIVPHLNNMIENGFHYLIDNKKTDELTMMYDLFFTISNNVEILKDVDPLHKMRDSWGDYIKKKTCEMVLDKDRDIKLIDDLLEFQKDMMNILSLCFRTDPDFSHVLKIYLENGINVKPGLVAELLAKSIDAKLKKGTMDVTTYEKNVSQAFNQLKPQTQLENVLAIFRYIQGKDVFEAFYKKDLAKRLLLNRTASLDMEKMMISCLKAECGTAFTKKLEGMFTDIDLSKNVMAQFHEHAISRKQIKKIPVDLQVQVLTTVHWPPYPISETIHLPEHFIHLKKIFDSFYVNKYQGRKLIWPHVIGQCIVKANFPKGKKDLVVSIFQTLVLLCFNEDEKDNGILYTKIRDKTGIDDAELRRTIQSLACGKVRVLTKRPKGKEVDDTDYLYFNSNFSHKLMRIRINSIQMKETKKEVQDTYERVFRERQYLVDAAIVRIMKSKKRMDHHTLVATVFQQIKFDATAADIKKRIESLIERDYMERDKNYSDVYIYIA